VNKKKLKKIFKTITYGFFFKIYGRINESIKNINDSRIKVEIINIEKYLKYKIYSISSGRLYTDRIQDAAAILDNKVIEGPSFQWRHTNDRKIYNSNIKENIIFSKGTPRFMKKLEGKVLSLLTGGGGNDNYVHWLFDVLPRLGLYSKKHSLDEINYFLLPSLEKKFQKETLDYLNIPIKKRLSSEKYRHIKAREIIFTDHPVVVTGDASEDNQKIPTWIMSWLKESFVKNNLTDKDNKKIYIDRGESTSGHKHLRSIINEDEVKKYLLKKNFTPVKLAEMNFIKQVELFNNADCIVGLHGAGFANLAFCKPGTKVIEFKNSGAGFLFDNVAKKNNLNYHPMFAEAKEVYNFQNSQGHIHVSIDELAQLLEKK